MKSTSASFADEAGKGVMGGTLRCEAVCWRVNTLGRGLGRALGGARAVGIEV